MNNWWHVSWKRVTIVLVAVFTLLFGLAFILNEATKLLTPWYMARTVSRDEPSVKVLPVPLTDQSVAPLLGNRFEAEGFSIQFPWSEAPLKRDAKYASVLAFPARGAGMILFGPAQVVDPQAHQQTRESLAEIVGYETAHSNYRLMAAELAATPDQVRWWKSPRGNARDFFLLGMKSMILHDEDRVYILNQGSVRGFEVGDPARPPYRVDLRLFDTADREYEILISSRTKSTLSFSQAEVNAIAASLRPNP